MMLRKLHPGISCFVFCLVLLLGCQDSGQELKPLQSATTLAVRAQEQFESQAVHAGSVNLDNPRGYMPKTPQWHLAYPVDLSVGQGLMVPVYYDKPFYVTSNISGRNRLAANAVTNLLVYTGADGALQYELLSSFPGNDGDAHFSGVIYVEDWHGNALKCYQYTADGVVNRLKSTGNSPTPTGKATTIEVCYYYQGWNHSASDPDGYYYEVLIGCEYFVVDDGSDSSGSPTGGDYGSGGSTPPGGGSPCAPLTAARAPAPCDGGTGGDGPYPVPTNPPPPPARKDIKNNIVDPCQRDQVNRLVSNSTFLQYMFGIGDKMTIEYAMGNLQPTEDAVTNAQLSGDYYTVITTLNSSRMLGASNEYIMATLIHEMYHARRGVADPTHTNAADHIYMTQHFNEMAALLQSFFPGMLLQTARDLTWGGLGETPAYGALSVSDRIRIERLNDDYQKGIRGTLCAAI